jgi:thymidylate kinase
MIMTGKVFTPAITNRPGILTLSGLDGTGKSSQAEKLLTRLATEDMKAGAIWNRWKPFLSLPIVKLARRTLSPVKEARTADYSNFTEAKKKKMESPLKKKIWQTMVWSEYSLQVRFRLLTHGWPFRGMICDRYVYDTLVDMAVNFSVSPGELESLCGNSLLDLFPVPVQAILIDIDPETGARRKDDGTPVNYLSDRRQLYLEMARITGAIVIDGTKTIDEISDEIWDRTGIWRSTLPGGKGLG